MEERPSFCSKGDEESLLGGGITLLWSSRKGLTPTHLIHSHNPLKQSCILPGPSSPLRQATGSPGPGPKATILWLQRYFRQSTRPNQITKPPKPSTLPMPPTRLPILVHNIHTRHQLSPLYALTHHYSTNLCPHSPSSFLCLLSLSQLSAEAMSTHIRLFAER
jgi:hypothetical protein